MFKTSFETETCSRCHGSGNYSFNIEYGDRCFKCGGRGNTLTKRGEMAYRFYRSLCEVPMSQLKIGDRIQVRAISRSSKRQYFYVGVITDIKRSEHETSYIGSQVEKYFKLVVFTKNEKFGASSTSGRDGTLVRVYRADDAERLNKALEYQATLTKKGTVRVQ